jgi:hypothetical protein
MNTWDEYIKWKNANGTWDVNPDEAFKAGIELMKSKLHICKIRKVTSLDTIRLFNKSEKIEDYDKYITLRDLGDAVAKEARVTQCRDDKDLITEAEVYVYLEDK